MPHAWNSVSTLIDEVDTNVATSPLVTLFGFYPQAGDYS